MKLNLVQLCTHGTTSSQRSTLIISENLIGLDLRAAVVNFDQSFQKSEARKVGKRAKALIESMSGKL
jgi:hypothetical protein